MSGGVAVLLALVGLLLIILGVRGTYSDAFGAIIQGNNGSEPIASGTPVDTAASQSGGRGGVK